MEMPFQRKDLNLEQKAFNKAMLSTRTNVEWVLNDVKTHFATVYLRERFSFRSIRQECSTKNLCFYPILKTIYSKQI